MDAIECYCGGIAYRKLVTYETSFGEHVVKMHNTPVYFCDGCDEELTMLDDRILSKSRKAYENGLYEIDFNR